MKEETLTGIAIGAGLTAAVFLAKSALSGPGGRAFLRAAVKSSLLAYEKTREVLAEVAESLEDIVAEVQDELRAEKMRQSQAAPPASEE